MVVATYINGKQLEAYEYGAGLCISVGMIVFAFADFTVLPNFSFYGKDRLPLTPHPVSTLTPLLSGIALVLVSITADSFLPNLQEKYFSKGASRSEVTYFTNLLVLGGMTVILASSGDIQVSELFEAVPVLPRA